MSPITNPLLELVIVMFLVPLVVNVSIFMIEITGCRIVTAKIIVELSSVLFETLHMCVCTLCTHACMCT